MPNEAEFPQVELTGVDLSEVNGEGLKWGFKGGWATQSWTKQGWCLIGIESNEG